MLSELKALELLSECTGDDIWSIDHCQLRSVPSVWVEELVDTFESGFRHDSETIYLDTHQVNQYRGIRDIELALKLGEYLGVDVRSILNRHLTRSSIVQEIKEAIEEA